MNVLFSLLQLLSYIFFFEIVVLFRRKHYLCSIKSD